MDRLSSRIPVVLVVAALLAAPIALSAGVKVRSQHDKTFDFRGLTTWAWHPDGAGGTLGPRQQRRVRKGGATWFLRRSPVT